MLQLTDFYGLPAEVAIMLMKYCFRIGKTSQKRHTHCRAGLGKREYPAPVDEGDQHLQKLEKRCTALRSTSARLWT